MACGFSHLSHDLKPDLATASVDVPDLTVFLPGLAVRTGSESFWGGGGGCSEVQSVCPLFALTVSCDTATLESPGSVLGMSCSFAWMKRPGVVFGMSAPADEGSAEPMEVSLASEARAASSGIFLAARIHDRPHVARVGACGGGDVDVGYVVQGGCRVPQTRPTPEMHP